jgi:hypothetical protein
MIFALVVKALSFPTSVARALNAAQRRVFSPRQQFWLALPMLRVFKKAQWKSIFGTTSDRGR